ncbi:MAG: GTPase Era [Cytophagales bacterium]|nr:GTPase Era [Cytophagales bacterium]
MSVNINHKSGFVAIVGKPNAGKSTLMNTILGNKLSIVTPKAQTTRHRILGILNEEQYQIVFSDTPGMILPAYKMQEKMMKMVKSSFEDADLLLYILDAADDTFEIMNLEILQKAKFPIWLVVNKIDLCKPDIHDKIALFMQKNELNWPIYHVSALQNIHVREMLTQIVKILPAHPPYYDKEDMSDKTERFFTTEIIREKILLYYRKEIPYSCEIVIISFKEKPDMIVIQAEIIVERDTQKGIIIGNKGLAIKKVGVEARKDLELFFGKKVFLETNVKVIKDWRSNDHYLKKFGYES